MTEASASSNRNRTIPTRQTIALLAALAVVYVGVTLWLGRQLTFYFDECDFLTRSLTNLDDLLRPHNEHWVTLAFIPYGTLKALVGTGSYAPYLLLLTITQIFMALGTYALLVRRSQLFALFAYTLLLFLGSGNENQFWAFQVGFVLATGFGVWAMAAADRGRLLLAALLLTAGAASSDIGVAFIPAVAAMIGWRRGLAWLALPVAAFGTWYEVYGRAATASERMFAPDQLALEPGYILGSVNHSIGGVTGLGDVAAPLILVALTVGAAVALVRGWRPSGLLVGAVLGVIALFAVIGLGRAQLPIYPPRYVTTAAVFMLTGAGSILPLRVAGRRGWALIAASVLLGVVALTSNGLAMREGAHTQLALDQTQYRCVPPGP